MYLSKSRFTILTAALLALLAAGVRPAHAQTEGLTITAEAGLDGYCKQGAWLPVRVTVANDGDDIEGILSAVTDSNSQVWDFSVEISVPSVSRKEWTLYVFPLQGEDEIVVRLRDGNTLIAQEVVPLTCVDRGDMLLGVWAANPSVFNSQTAIRLVAPRPALVQIDASDLPDRPLGLAMLDTLTISDVDTSSLTGAQQSALLTWVAGGGRLVVAGGPGWQKTGAGLETMLPLLPTGTETLDGLDAIAGFAQQEELPAGAAVAATGELQPGGEVILSQDGVPLIVSRPHGFGEIIYLAVDPALEPLRTWIGMEDLYSALLGRPPDTPTWHDGFKTWNEAEIAMNTVPGLGLPSAWLVCGFILCYIGVIGPLNFFVLRSLKKRELAWVSIPVLVLGFSGVIFLFGTNLVGSRPIVNRMSIVQVWPGEQQARLDALLGIFSPARGQYSLSMEASFSAHPVPQTGFAAEREQQAVFQTDSGFEIPEIQVGTGGLEGFVVAGQIEAPRFDYDLQIESAPGGSRQLTGQITNTSRLRLSDALVLAPGGSFSIGDFGPGDSASVTITLGSGSATPIGPPPAISGLSTPDDTLIQVFGTNYMYPTSGTAIEDIRRFNLLSAAYDGFSGTRGGGVFLLGWTDEAPFETELGGGQERTTDTTLYIVHLRPLVEPALEGSLANPTLRRIGESRISGKAVFAVSRFADSPIRRS